MVFQIFAKISFDAEHPKTIGRYQNLTDYHCIISFKWLCLNKEKLLR